MPALPNPNPYVSDTYLTIARRLATFTPPICIEHHIGSDLFAGRNTLKGISFVTNDVNRLLSAFRAPKDDDGNKVFVEGSKEDPQHWNNQGDPNNWPIRMSFSETHGIGFREIWRPRLSERPLRFQDAEPKRYRHRFDTRFSANFNDSLTNNSSIHCAVAPDICNIHIDEMGFVMIGPTGDIMVDPDFAQHLVNELWLKSKLDHKLPDWLIDRLSLDLPNSTNDYSRIGVSFDLAQKKTYRVRWTASCSVLGNVDCSTTLSISGTFDELGSK
jgi:hypothetical protein